MPPHVHTEVVDKAFAPTCTSTGLTEGKHCSECGEVIVAQQTIAATGEHNYENSVCSVCGAVKVIDVPNDVVINGDNEELANEVIEEIQTNEALAGLLIENLPENGSLEIAVSEININENALTELVFVVSPMDADGNKVETFEAGKGITFRLPIPSSVTESYAIVYHEDAIHGVYEIKTLGGDKYIEVYSENFSEYGVVLHNHEYESTVTAPTCTTKGYTTYTCACGETYIADEVGVLGHTFVDGVCSLCGAEDPDYVAPHIHEYESTVIAPTCTVKGYTKYTCLCGDSYIDDYVNATGHSFDITEVVEPTCTTQGYFKVTCYCGFVIVHDIINATGHNYCNWNTIKYPTLIEEGIEERGCYTCGEIETRAIPPHSHSEGLEMTLNADGNSYSVTGIGICTDMDVYIPVEYNGLPVTIIGEQAFYGCSFDNVFIPEGIVTIENSAFACTSITNIIIPKSVTSIGSGAFIGTKLTSVVIPEGVTSIGGGAFGNCKYLSEISVPDSIVSFGLNMFRTMEGNANIKYNKYKGGLYIGNENNPYVVLMSIEDISITSFEIHPDTKIIALTPIWRVDINKPQEFGEPLKFVSNHIKKLSNTIPNNINKNVINIATSKDVTNEMIITNGNALSIFVILPKSIFIPKNEDITGILNDINEKPIVSLHCTFSGCRYLTSTPKIPDSAIDFNRTFQSCSSLIDASSIQPKTAISMEYTFAWCSSLKTLPDLSNTNVTMLDHTFSNCIGIDNAEWSNLKLPYNVQMLEGTFLGTSIENVSLIKIPDSVTSLAYAFYGCKSIKESYF